MADYIYETKEVSSSRKEKWCDVCGKTIRVGKPSITIVTHSDDGFRNEHVCSRKCEKKYVENFGKPEGEDEE